MKKNSSLGGILVSESHCPALWPSHFERFDRQLRYISDRCSPSESPVDVLQKIIDARICIVGLGGLGTNILQQLVPMGFHNYLLIDPDQVDVSNLNRTAIYCPRDAGKSKVSVCEAWIRNRASDSIIEGATSILDEQTLTRISSFSPDVVINCADTPSIFDSTRKLIKNLKQRNIPILVGGGYFLGNSFSGPFIIPQEKGCLDCFADKREDANISKVGGSISPFPSIAASISSLDLFNFITKLDKLALHHRQIIFEADSISFKYRDLPANELCATCG